VWNLGGKDWVYVYPHETKTAEDALNGDRRVWAAQATLTLPAAECLARRQKGIPRRGSLERYRADFYTLGLVKAPIVKNDCSAPRIWETK
jgi:hypothetical protein